jgi:hypothetical protein
MAVFEPETLPPGLVVAIAVTPSVLAGLVFFKVLAVEALTLALAIGGLLQVLAWRLRLGSGIAPLVATVIAVALLGPAAPPAWIGVAAALGGALELARRRWLPSLRMEAGLVAAVAVFLASRGLTAAYLNPGGLKPLAEPIRLWSAYYGGAAAPIDPVRLYVGNVPGPMFATSLVAVVIGAAWLWYAHRLSLAVLLGFGAGAAIPIALWHWNPGYQLDSGPAWFVIALLLADRAYLPDSRASRPLLGFAAGIAGVGVRRQGFGIEAVFAAVTGLQLAVAAVEGAEWAVVHRSNLFGSIKTVHPAPSRSSPAGRRRQSPEPAANARYRGA